MIDVALAVLSAFLQVLFDRITPRDILEFLKGNNLDEALLKKLTILLLSVNAVLDDAEEKQILDPNVKAWVEQYKWSSKSETIKGKISDFLSPVNPRLEKINEKLSFLLDLKNVLGLKEGKGQNLSSLSLPTTCLLEEFEVLGRNDDKEKIIDFLLGGNGYEESLSVVAIVGMAGIGKTTLSQLLFNDERVSHHFDLRLWVHVSEGSDVFDVIKKIYECLNCESRDLNMLQVKLKSRLIRNKKFLLVLDDFYVGNYIEWELLKRPLAEGARGSVVLVTTRNEKVSSIMHPTFTHSLQLLSHEDSWKLFAHYAFIMVCLSKCLYQISSPYILFHFLDDAKNWDNRLKTKIGIVIKSTYYYKSSNALLLVHYYLMDMIIVHRLREAKWKNSTFCQWASWCHVPESKASILPVGAVAPKLCIVVPRTYFRVVLRTSKLNGLSRSCAKQGLEVYNLEDSSE
ncbi:hypothetical protein L6164_023384 [Bauhinia variegata]|uniref:Uncharacterized protein n=1 Tax=Bauhinia variegata TaxID=167791 RepID=A0ACB9MIN9_BAUVA|nr:hypothetical protein L6164_023384 [Bauhinia variegata]